MSWIKKVFGAGLSQTVDSFTGLIDGLHTDKEEKGKIIESFNEMMNSFRLAVEKEITERHKSDMASDSWLSKNIRPLTLIFILASYTLFSIADGNLSWGDFKFNVHDEYVELLGEWGKAIMYFYFGGRTVEKVTNLWNKYRK